MQTTDVKKLIINRLTKEQYEAEKEAGTLNENELYVTPEETPEAPTWSNLQGKPFSAVDTTTLGVDSNGNLKWDWTAGEGVSLSDKEIGADFNVVASTTYVGEQVSSIRALIPNQASAQNQLADKDFVNSSINSVSAFPITYNAAGDGFPTIGDLTGATVYYSGGVVRVPTTNDYAFVTADTSKATQVSGYASFTTTAEYVGYYVMYNSVATLVTADNKDSVGITAGTTVAYISIPSTRYVYSVPAGQTTGAWNFQAKVSEISLTAAQIKAINSGITDTLVAMIQNGVRFTAQSLTSAEKAQARTNIGAAATTDIPALTPRDEVWKKPTGETESVTYYVAQGGIPQAAGEEF